MFAVWDQSVIIGVGRFELLLLCLLLLLMILVLILEELEREGSGLKILELLLGVAKGVEVSFVHPVILPVEVFIAEKWFKEWIRVLFISLFGSWIFDICKVGDEGEDEWLLLVVKGFEKRYELLDAVFGLFVLGVLLEIVELPLLMISH